MEWSYVAGYFDGEGSVSCTPDGRGGNGRTRFLSWYNSNLKSLEAMKAFMGVGRIVARPPKGISKKTVYVLVISKRSEILAVLENMMPYLIIKRERAEFLANYLKSSVRDMTPNFGSAASASTADLLRMYWKEGKSYAEIGATLGVGYSAVGREFRERGLPSRDSGGTHMRGKPKSEETKKRMRESRRKLWEDPEFRARQLANMAKSRTPESRKKMGETRKRKFREDAEFRSRQLANLAKGPAANKKPPP